MSDPIKFNFLSDKPVSQEQSSLLHFYHEKFSPALREIVENDSCVHTIGLFGRWGTGKSTIIDLLRKDLGSSKIFVFDAWKYQDDALRRIFLIKFVEFLKKEDFKVEKNILDPLYKGIETHAKDEQNKKLSNKICEYLKRYWVIGVIVGLGLFWMVSEYFKGNVFFSGVKNISKYLFSLTVVVTMFKPILEKIINEFLEKIFKSNLSLSEVRTKVEKEERLNSPEQFEALFGKIIKSVNKKIVIVFDNVDRVQGDTAIKILSTIKTFLDPVEKQNVVFIVPCDSDAIVQQIRSFYGEEVCKGESFDPYEYLRKLFNLIVFTPEFIDVDLEEYIKNLLGQIGELSKLLNNEDVVHVISKAFYNNPREIKQFINNLISAVVVISKTEVNDVIVQKEKIAYLAKVLVLKQKYPKAYACLKEKWYNPEDIVSDKKDIELVAFLNNTSRITTDDAEPYIYFKRPCVAENVDAPDVLRQALLTGDQKQFVKTYSSEKNKAAAIDFVLLLFKRYSNQHNILLNIFKTQLTIFAESSGFTAKKGYYEEALKILDSQLWQYYISLPTDLIFSFLLNSARADSRLKNMIVERYVFALSGDEMKKPENEEFLLGVLRNILEQQRLLSTSQKTKIAQAIEQAHSTNFLVFDLFQEAEDQEGYITDGAFEKFINSINSKMIGNNYQTIIKYKSFIKKHGFEELILNKITEWVSKETSESSDYGMGEGNLAKAINELIYLFREKIKDLKANNKNRFGQVFVVAFNNIRGWNNRGVLINAMRLILPYLDAPQQNEYSQLIRQYFQNASAENIKSVFDFWDKDFASTFLGEYINFILQRFVNDTNVLKVVYSVANKEQQLQVIDHLIKNMQNYDIDFISSLENDLPDRQEVIRKLLAKAIVSHLSSAERYMPIQKKSLEKMMIMAIKDMTIVQIKKLLKDEALSVQQIGYDFLSGSDFLSLESKREIGKEIVEHLRKPGKSITEAQAPSLNAVADLFDKLQETPKHDFIYLLFDSIRQEKSSPAIGAFVGIIGVLKPQFAEFEKDYRDLLERLKNWPESETKSLVISKIAELKPKSPKKGEKEYWLVMDKLIKRHEK